MEKNKLNNLGIQIDINNPRNEVLRKDLIEQLQARNKYEEYFVNLVDDYIFYSNLKDLLKKDIDERGFNYKRMTGNGFEVDTPNESVRNIITLTNLMLRILKDLDLNEPEIVADDFDGQELY